jgi:hypothetical protein
MNPGRILKQLWLSEPEIFRTIKISLILQNKHHASLRVIKPGVL